MIKEYLIDPYIIAVLFQVEEPEKVLELHREILDKEGKVYDLVIKNHLLAKGFSIEQITALLNFENDAVVPAEMTNALNDLELIKKIQVAIQQLLKAFYDNLLPNLEQAKQIELINYLNTNYELIKEQQAAAIKGISVVTSIMETAGIKDYSQIEQKAEINDHVDNLLKTITK